MMKTIASILFALSLAVSAAAGAAPLAAGKQRFLGSAYGPSQTQDFTRAFDAFVAKERPVFEGN
jgi:endo-1,4-beta-xylanase